MRRAAVAILIAAAAITAAVATAYPYAALGPVDAPNPGTDARPDAPSYVPSEEAVVANNEFAVRFYKTFPVDENIFFSPAGIRAAFSALYEGAKGDTAAQMKDVFGFNPDAEARHGHAAYVAASANRDDPQSSSEMASALWIADWLSPSGKYLDAARGGHLADVETVDFFGDDINRINQWTSDKSRGTIDKAIAGFDVDERAAMTVSSVVYFNESWAKPFANATFKGYFWRGETATSVHLMGIKETFGYVSSDGADVVKIPYEGDRLSMLVIMPKRGTGLAGLADLADRLSAEQMAKWSENLQPSPVFLTFPMFEMRQEYDLKSALAGMGMAHVFDENFANLTGIGSAPGGRNMFVSGAAQHTYINVDEDNAGLDGWLYEDWFCIVCTTNGAVELQPYIIDFTVNQPFLFVIQDDATDMILFMGSVVDPKHSMPTGRILSGW